MIQPRTYTERIAVRITTELRDSLRAKLADTNEPVQGLGAAMRQAALHAIGRADLVMGDDRNEAGHQARRSAAGDWIVIGVNLTPAQKRALAKAAKSGEVALSALLRDSLVAELGLPRPKASARGGWPLGARKSGRPKQ